MKKSRFYILMLMCLMALLAPMLVSAQVGGPLDTDGDGLPDSSDACPTQAGPREFGGCPDSDGDGTSDNIDACPTQGGPDSNRGCPVEQPAENPVPENTTNPVRPVVGGECTIATFLATAVNIREYPAPDAPVLGTLDPSVLHAVLGMYVLPDSTWYLVEGGWVSGVAVVLGGDCDGASVVHVHANYGGIVSEGQGYGIASSDPESARICIELLHKEHCFGPLTIAVGPDGGETQGSWKKICKGIKGKIVCFLVEEIVFAIWDWWNEDDGASIDPTTNPDLLVFDIGAPDTEGDNAGKSKLCKGIKGKIVCFLVEEIVDWFVDWWNEDETEGAVVDLHKLTSTILVPTRSENVGDPTTADGSVYPWCEDLLNALIAQHTPSDGSSPLITEEIGNYLVTSLVLNPDVPLPQQQPCKKWVDMATNIEDSRTNLGLGAVVIEYDSWPPNGWVNDLTGNNSTVPVIGLLLPAVQPVREAAYVTPADGALVIDFLGNSTVDERGGIFIEIESFQFGD
jgi:hypothetical protein